MWQILPLLLVIGLVGARNTTVDDPGTLTFVSGANITCRGSVCLDSPDVIECKLEDAMFWDQWHCFGGLGWVQQLREGVTIECYNVDHETIAPGTCTIDLDMPVNHLATLRLTDVVIGFALVFAIVFSCTTINNCVFILWTLGAPFELLIRVLYDYLRNYEPTSDTPARGKTEVAPRQPQERTSPTEPPPPFDAPSYPPPYHSLAQ